MSTIDFNQIPPRDDLHREPIRQSLYRYYTARTDPTRTREARRQTKALRLARQLKERS